MANKVIDKIKNALEISWDCPFKLQVWKNLVLYNKLTESNYQVECTNNRVLWYKLWFPA
jgi:hypothetical protein